MLKTKRIGRKITRKPGAFSGSTLLEATSYSYYKVVAHSGGINLMSNYADSLETMILHFVQLCGGGDQVLLLVFCLPAVLLLG